MDPFDTSKTHYTIHKKFVIASFAIKALLALAILILVIPAMKGYYFSKTLEKINETQSINDLQTQLAFSGAEAASCTSRSTQLQTNLDDEHSQRIGCEQDKLELDAEKIKLKRDIQLNISAAIQPYEKNNQDLRDQITTLDARYKASQASYTTLGKNAANNICCKVRVDSPAIDSYTIVNDRIICTTGEPTTITCS